MDVHDSDLETIRKCSIIESRSIRGRFHTPRGLVILIHNGRCWELLRLVQYGLGADMHNRANQTS